MPQPTLHTDWSLAGQVVITHGAEESSGDGPLDRPLTPRGFGPTEGRGESLIGVGLKQRKVVDQVPADVLLPGMPACEADLTALVEARAHKDEVRESGRASRVDAGPGPQGADRGQVSFATDGAPWELRRERGGPLTEGVSGEALCGRRL